jgi:hypothetical protein
MSFVILAIGAAHAIPPIVGAAIGKSKPGVIVGSVIGGLIAFASGNPAFIAADLIGVGLGTWFGFSMIESKSEEK